MLTFFILLMIGGIAMLLMYNRLSIEREQLRSDMNKKIEALNTRLKEAEENYYQVLARLRVAERASAPPPKPIPPKPVPPKPAALPPQSEIRAPHQEPAASLSAAREQEDKLSASTESPPAAASLMAHDQAPSALTGHEPLAESVSSEAATPAKPQDRSTEPHTVTPAHPPVPPQATLPEPDEMDDIISRGFRAIINYFKSGNTVVKAGVVVLFFGVAFLVKLAADQGFVPPWLRLAAAALAGVGLSALGWHLRRRKPEFAQVIQGGGVGILFITTYAALRLYHYIPAPLAFALFVVQAGAIVTMALFQDSKSLAIFGISGGFMAPVLASTGEGSHIALFSYFALLNMAVLTIAFKKAWRIVNLIAFGFTFVIGTIFGVLTYQSSHFGTTEPFLILFFLIFVAVPLLFSRSESSQHLGYVDGTLVFGTPAIAFALQSVLVAPFRYATAASAFGLGLFYLLLTWWHHKTRGRRGKLLTDAYLSLGVVFGTLSIPLAFDGRVTASTWALEAAGVYWISTRQRRFWGRLFSVLLIPAASVAFAVQSGSTLYTWPLLNNFFLGAVLIAGGALTISFICHRNKKHLRPAERVVSPLLFGVGTLWWLLASYIELESHLVIWWHANLRASSLPGFPDAYVVAISALFLSLIFMGNALLGRRLSWRYPTLLSYSLVYLLAFTLLRFFVLEEHPVAHGGVIMWPLGMLAAYFVLFFNRNLKKIPSTVVRYSHATALWLLATLLTWEAVWQLHRLFPHGEAWHLAAMGAIPTALAAVVLWGHRWLAWPLRRHHAEYLTLGAMPLLGLTGLWLLVSTFASAGNASPAPFITLLNPLELSQLAYLVVLSAGLLSVRSHMHLSGRSVKWILGGTYFLWVNGLIVRALHHYTGVPYTFSHLFDSPLVQMSLSICWTVVGITLMIFASRRRWRWVWITGASFLGVVVLKLFLVDLSKSGTVERIVSFITVGLFLLLVGYFSPIPPVADKTTPEK